MEGKNYNMIWTDNPKHGPLKYGCVNNPQVYNANKSSIMQITVFNEDVNLCGDLFFRLINARNGQVICRFALNTSFIGKDNIYTLNKKGVDPDSIGKDKRFDPLFKIELKF